MAEKQYLTAQDLLLDSFELGLRIFKSGFRPSFIIGVWRGGTPVGIAVQEILDLLGVKTDHIAIRTSSYYGIDKRDKKVRVHGLEYVVQNANWEDGLLIVDDVFDTGNSIKAILEA
ncbi:MAG: hypoxanthine phosphoribosyltransferase, partial [Desulfobacterales bacterium]